MANTYDVSTVVSRSYISEQLQQEMQNGQEQKSALFLQEFVKEYEQKQASVREVMKSEDLKASEHALKQEEERKKKKRNKDIYMRHTDNHEVEDSLPTIEPEVEKVHGSKLDIEA